MNLIPGLKLRADEEAEVLGMDDAEIGEFAVSTVAFFQLPLLTICQYDYVELTRDVVNGDNLDDITSKYSAEGDSPIEPHHEKTFSSAETDAPHRLL